LPLFEYQCQKCGVKIEKIQKFTAPTSAKCESCGGRIERLLSSPAIQFKGTGWYITDYARKSGSAAGSNSSGSKSESKSESTAPATTTPSKPAAESKKQS
jgi:putative FmdB family regulatory protein